MPQLRKYAANAARQAAYRRRARVQQEKLLATRGLPPLPAIAAMPGAARWKAALSQAALLLAQVKDEMDCYWQDRSETWQEGERGELMSEQMEALERIAGEIEEVMD